MSLVQRALGGDRTAVARLISLVEDESPLLREVMAALAPHAGLAHIVGITGSPGVGKSTSTSALVSAYRAMGKRVGVLAVECRFGYQGQCRKTVSKPSSWALLAWAPFAKCYARAWTQSFPDRRSCAYGKRRAETRSSRSSSRALFSGGAAGWIRARS